MPHQTFTSRLTRKLSRRRDGKRGTDFKKIITLTGQDFVDAANTHIARFYKSSATFGYDAETQKIIASTAPLYRFSLPRRMNYFVNGLEHRGRQLANEYLLDSIAFEDGDHIVESGGNDGDFMLALRGQNMRFSLTSFEPSPREYSTYALNMQQMDFLDAAETNNLALWNTTGDDLPFFVKSDTADSSLHEIDGASEVVKVRTTRLDDALPRKRYKLLKLEAEGAEPEILEGAAGILDCFDYITADVGFERGLRQESTLPEVTNFLLRNNFSVVRFGTPRHVVLFANNKTVPSGITLAPT